MLLSMFLASRHRIWTSSMHLTKAIVLISHVEAVEIVLAHRQIVYSVYFGAMRQCKSTH